MQNNELESKMNKHIGISLEALNWFILCGFLKSIVDDPEKVMAVFKSSEDCLVIEGLTKRIAKQFDLNLDKALEQEEDKLDIENILKLPPKKLILPKGDSIIS